MILYRVSGRTSARGMGLQWMDTIVGTNCAEVQKKASAILKNCRKQKYQYDLRLQRLTIHPPHQSIMIKALERDDLCELIQHCETLEHWKSDE